jgi:UDP-2,3-diacylglucosamine hydrolase
MIPAGQIVVIGDSHIGLTDGSETRVVSWLERLAALRPRALYLNGDLFHYLIAHPKFYTNAVGKVFDAFRALRDSGVAIHYVEGNRDFFLAGSFVEESVTDVALEYAVQAGERRYLVVHGDMINDRDLPYRFWRRLSKNPISKFSINLIPKRFARGIVDGVEKKLASSNFKHKSRVPVELMEAYGTRRSREGFTDVIFGHFHNKLVLHGKGTRFFVLPPWYETGEAMVIDPGTGAFQFLEI